MESGGNQQQGVYEIWRNGLEHYLDMYEKGLKKQANQYISGFMDEFRRTVPKEDLEETLQRFCRDICDENRYSRLLRRGNGSLPYALGGVVWSYLKEQCGREAMPHMRWAFQLFGTYYNPFNPQLEVDMQAVLKKAYEHRDCDQKTVELYFSQILEWLYWGAHHFPEGCLIARAAYEAAVEAAEKVLAEKCVPQELTEAYGYYRRLYECFYAYEAGGREEDFYQLCGKAGIGYRSVPAYYYSRTKKPE